MRIQLAPGFKNTGKNTIGKDVLAGLILMAVSIPISMGYAQIAGLPAVYGLYGSVFPILLFALFSSSPQFIFGVDAAPAALVGAALVNLDIQSESAQAMKVVPVITFMVAVWLLAFYIMKAGKLVSFISAPVMGGFITGICTTIILMQAPKLMGGTAGTGEFPELASHIGATLGKINVPSLVLGLVSLIILLVAKKWIPKFPMAIVLMAAGAIMTVCLPVKQWGVHTLSAVEPGLPVWQLPDFTAISMKEAVTISLSVAVVIMAETLLAENNFAQKNGYKINDNQEIFAFSMGNLAAALTGCCPVNGSVSRTAMGEQYQARTQLASVVAGVSMLVLLLFGTGFVGYLPVPVLTAIVISALLGATEFHLAVRLWKISRTECFIFIGAFVGVLFLGTINGVLIGVILDASAIGSIDITAADRLELLYRSLNKKNIRFYITEHIADLNGQMRKLGLGYLIEEGCVRRTIHIALKDMGIHWPYPLEGGVKNEERAASRKRADNRVQEFVWAFGNEAEDVIERQIRHQIRQLKESGDVEELLHGRWAHMEELDEDEWMEHLEEHLKEIVNISGKDEQTLAKRMEEHRKQIQKRIATEHPELAERFRQRRHILDQHLKEKRPEVYELVMKLREKELL